VASHDRTFLRRVCRDVLVVGGGRLDHRPDGMGAYLDDLQAAVGEQAPSLGKRPSASGGPSKAVRKRLHAIDKRRGNIEDQVARLDVEVADLERELPTATDLERAQAIDRRLAELRAQCDKLEEEWFELGEAAGELEAEGQTS